MLTIGLTGGIGSGKSQVATFFERLGVAVVDADVIARQLVEPGTDVLSEIVTTFGRSVLTSEGGLDRTKLAEIVFSDTGKKKKLENIIHPRVREQIRAFKQEHRDQPYILVVIPLLLESGQHDLVDRVLVVNAAEAERIRRVQARDGRNEQQIRAIIDSQADDATRRATADDYLDNNGTLAELEHSVRKLHRQYLSLSRSDNFM
ncbi:MAG: dephospho-CoA kinase [Gammaproteobacteria bacterium]|jgi:dephospho-CoA kinase